LIRQQTTVVCPIDFRAFFAEMGGKQGRCFLARSLGRAFWPLRLTIALHAGLLFWYQSVSFPNREPSQ
jgi:hypothetical protein